jgi:sugar phosphate permease
MTIATVPLFHAMQIWAVALEQQFGWTRTQLSWALTLTRIEGGIMGPIEGYLTDKLGARRMILLGLLILGGGFILFSQIHALWIFYVAYMVMALGQGLGSWLPMMTTINNWFSRQRAKAIGWASVGSRLGALLLVPAIAWAIDPEYDRLGWSLTALIFGIICLAAAVPLSRLVRNRPQDYNQYPDGVAPEREATPASSAGRAPAQSGGAESGDFTAGQALRTPAFWLISVGHGFTSMVILAIFTHLGLLMQDKGFHVQDTAWLVTVYTAVGMVFQIVGGYIGDRIPKRVGLFIFTSIQASAVVVLTLASSLLSFYLFAILFGIGFGGRSPLTVAIRGEYFGRTSFGKILGLSTVPMNVLLLISSPFAGYMYDVQGTYEVAFFTLAGLNFLGGVLFLLARRPPLPSATPRPSRAARAA